VQIRGRVDGAIHSGGETVFPEQPANASCFMRRSRVCRWKRCCCCPSLVRNGGSVWWRWFVAVLAGLRPRAGRRCKHRCAR
jgi:hypothetical protein